MRLASIFEEDPGVFSWARVMSTITALVACGVVVHLVWHNHASPDAVTLGALGLFGVFPYTVNKVSTSFGKAQ